jgi:hypothetical protein
MMTTHGSPTDGGGARGPGRPATARRSFVTTRTRVALVLLAVVDVVENREPTTSRLRIPVVLMPVCAALATTLMTGLIMGRRRT